MNEYLSIGKASVFLGLSISTLRRWEKLGKLSSFYRTFGNHRRYKISDLLSISNNIKNDERKTIAYARVSTYKQKQDLENQKTTITVFSTRLYGKRSHKNRIKIKT